MWMFLAALSLAQPGESSEPPQFRMGLRGVAEQWSDTSISSAYTQGAPIGAVGLGVPITDRLWVDVEVGYRRLNTETDETLSFSLIPASIVAEWSFGQGRARPFLAAGPTLTAFHEQHSPNADGRSATSGARIAGELRFGGRIDTGLITPARAPAPSVLQSASVELYVARRQARPFGGRNGLDLGAWRAALGISFAL
jgi:hypothetical protein